MTTAQAPVEIHRPEYSWEPEVIHEQVNIFRKQGIVVTVNPDGSVELSQQNFMAHEFPAFLDIIDELRQEVVEQLSHDTSDTCPE